MLKDGYWEIQDAWMNFDQKPPERMPYYQIPTNLTFGKIQESLAAPNTISFWELPRFIRTLKAIGLPPGRHQLEYQKILAQPMLLCAMVAFAAAFSLRMSRRGNVLALIISGVVVGSVVYTLNNIVIALGITQTLPMGLAAWAIPLAALAISSAALLHLEDG